MNLSADDIHQWITTGTTETLGWLEDHATVQEIATIIVAMANQRGGKCLIGLTGENGTITGVEDVENTVDRVLQAALSIAPPLIIPLPEVVKIQDKRVLVVQIPPGMPHVYALDGRYLRRENTTNVALNPRDLRRLMMERGELNFETDIAHSRSMADIDWDKAQSYVSGLSGLGEASVETVLTKRGCLTMQNGSLRPTNAGILLFGKDPQRYNRGAEITAVRFAGETMSDTFSRQDIVGTLPDQIRRAETFLVDHLRKGVQLKDTMVRQENYEYPLEAARELVVNAVAHRDYSISGDGIRLFIYSNQMEIISPGGLPGPVTIANIKDERFSRNPAIVQVLADMGFIERLGYGVDRVIELMQQQSLRAPEFEERARGFRVVLYNRPEPIEEVKPKSPEMPTILSLYKDSELNPRQEVALNFLHNEANSRITNSDLKRLCPDVHPETIRRDLAALVTKNILVKMGQKRGSYYVLKQD